MFSSRLLLATATLACWSFAAAAATPAAPADIGASLPVTRGELPGLIKQAIMNDPNMILEAMQKLRDAQAKDTDKKAQAALEKNKAALEDASAPSVGPKNADVTMVEFFDYHCGYCKQLYPSIVKLNQNDKKLRIVFREFPILSEDSVRAARTALAINHIAPDKYFAFYSALMKENTSFDEKSLLDTAEKVGVNKAKLEAALKDKAVDKSIGDELMQNRKLADELGIHGTPGIVIGDHLFPGAMPYETLTKVIADIRSGKDKKVDSDATAN